MNEVLRFMRPSYDIYAATDIFARIPLEKMGFDVSASTPVEPLSDEEIKWLHRLTAAAAKEKPGKIRKHNSPYLV